MWKTARVTGPTSSTSPITPNLPASVLSIVKRPSMHAKHLTCRGAAAQRHGGARHGVIVCVRVVSARASVAVPRWRVTATRRHDVAGQQARARRRAATTVCRERRSSPRRDDEAVRRCVTTTTSSRAPPSPAPRGGESKPQDPQDPRTHRELIVNQHLLLVRQRRRRARRAERAERAHVDR